MNTYFPTNLRLLTDHYKSVAEVCRLLGVNRSQYNKYLSGRSAPSRFVLKSICEFFGVEEHEILLPHAQFEKLIRLRSRPTNVLTKSKPYLIYLDQLTQRSRDDLQNYEGYYFEYSYSMACPGLILRSLIHVVNDAGLVSYRRFENMARQGKHERRVPCKYRGMAFYLNDRIFLVDHDSLTGNEISQTVLYPNHRGRISRLSGLKLGVAASMQREPLCARVVLDPLGLAVNSRTALMACGLFEPDSLNIEPGIRDRITNRIDDGAHHFQVVPGV